MKRCRTCDRTYTDPNLIYCIDDGTPLIAEVEDDESTVVNTSPNGRSTDDDWNAVAYRPPSQYVPLGTAPGKQRRTWPWIVGVLGAFVLGAVVLMVAFAVYVPRMMRTRQAPPVAVTPGNSDRPDQPVPPEDSDASAPTDEAQVLAQLTDLENDWTAANLNADRKKLDRILADDYVGPSAQDGLEGKKDYIEGIRPNSAIERWEFADLKVDLSGNHAMLSGTITYFGGGQQQAFDFTDKFVWRNGRWQATGSEVHPKQ